MATQLCEKCKQAHPGRVCDYDEKGECAETIDTNPVTHHQRTKSANVPENNPEAESPPYLSDLRLGQVNEL